VVYGRGGDGKGNGVGERGFKGVGCGVGVVCGMLAVMGRGNAGWMWDVGAIGGMVAICKGIIL
jgi:hypothetical protein